MATKLQELKWNLYKYKSQKMLIHGLKNGDIEPYGDYLIEQLRDIYYGGVPASIILLSDGLSNGYCYDRVLLMARAFLDSDNDINLIYASIDSFKLNPKCMRDDDPLYADHCFLERITRDGRHLIYDTSTGFIYNKKIYWAMEHPQVRKINNKESIIKFLKEEDERHPENLEKSRYCLPAILPMIEETYGSPYEMYSVLGIELLQREMELFKEKVNYDNIMNEIHEDIKNREYAKKK